MQYKDAFLSANPDFKWYKLPAPPLRTLNTRPANIQKPISPVPINPINLLSPKAEFTPGKLADESQLGSLTSLLNMNNGFNNNNNNNKIECETSVKSFLNNNNVEEVKSQGIEYVIKTPTEATKTTLLPPKPIKKRIFEKYNDNKNVSRNIFDCNNSSDANISALNNNNNNGIGDKCDSGNKFEPNMTQQELLNKVVDRMFIEERDADVMEDKDDPNETRKSGRSCKGKRYEKFMVEGKLLSSKRDKNQQRYFDLNKKFEYELHNKIETLNKTENQTPKLDLENTIKRLTERTRYKTEDLNPQKPAEETPKQNEERTRSISETSDDSFTKNLQNDFNLDLRIKNLPSLSYDTYVQRKRESKKRKVRPKVDNSQKNGDTNVKIFLIGSKKRKNKQSITHLEKKPEMASFSSDLSGLATLAEVAANTEKIN